MRFDLENLPSDTALLLPTGLAMRFCAGGVFGPAPRHCECALKCVQKYWRTPIPSLSTSRGKLLYETTRTTENGGWQCRQMTCTRIGVVQAFNGYVERVFDKWCKETHCGKTEAK